jgi:hypothetical protein
LKLIIFHSQAMDFFNIISEDGVVLAISFCGGKELLKLMETCKRLKEIISKNTKLMEKIELRFMNSHEYFDVKQLMASRKFVNLSLHGDPPSASEKHAIMLKSSRYFERCQLTFFHKIIVRQATSVKKLSIYRLNFYEQDLFGILQVFSLDELKLDCVNIYEHSEAAGNSPRSGNFNPKLKSLTVDHWNIYFSRFFKDYKLKRLELCHYRGRMGPLTNFLHGQTQLEHFDYKPQQMEVNVFVNDVIEFVRTLNGLRKLSSLKLPQQIPEDFIQAVRHHPTLHEIEFQTEMADDETSPLLLRNHHVDTCAVVSDIPHEMLKKFKIEPSGNVTGIIYNPPLIPEDVEQFEADSLSFLIANSSTLEVLSVGHATWIDANFSFSTNFYKQLIEGCNLLKVLEIHNVFELDELMLNAIKRHKLHQILVHPRAGCTLIINIMKSRLLCSFSVFENSKSIDSPFIPEDAAQFQDSILEHASKNTDTISVLSIGHKTWIEDNFSLPTEFYKKLIGSLKSLEVLEVFNFNNLNGLLPVAAKQPHLKEIRVQLANNQMLQINLG